MQIDKSSVYVNIGDSLLYKFMNESSLSIKI